VRYMMRERILSWGDDFSIKDADGREVYYIDGKVFSFGNTLSIKDRDGGELARINQKLLSFGPQYEIVSGGETVAVVKKHLFTPFRGRFTVDVPGPDDLEARGDFLDHEYVFEQSGKVVARVSKKWFSLADTYAVDIDQGQNEVLLLAAAVVIDLVSHPEENNS
jgi:uncharacterized protein YxjI